MVELNTGEQQPKRRGQAMVEYALILALLAVAFGVAIAATGPAIGNVFCNVVHNLGGNTADPKGGDCGNASPDLFSVGNPTPFWATVTWVAGNPQGETPFPTPLKKPPTSASGGVNPPTATFTPTNTPTNTNTPTPTQTGTQTDTPTPGPSPTYSDFVFEMPHVDQVSKPEWWRLDTGDFMGYAEWTAQWYNNMSSTVNAGGWRNITLSGAKNYDPALTDDINGLSFDWGSGYPSGTGITGGNTFGGDFNRDLDVVQDATYQFTLQADDYANVYLDGSASPFLWRSSSGTSTKTIDISAGNHTLRVLYAENTGTASIQLTVARLSVNPDELGSNQRQRWLLVGTRQRHQRSGVGFLPV